MSELVPNALHAELRALIASSRQRLAGAVNAELTRLYVPPYLEVGVHLHQINTTGNCAAGRSNQRANVGEKRGLSFVGSGNARRFLHQCT